MVQRTKLKILKIDDNLETMEVVRALPAMINIFYAMPGDPRPHGE